MSTFLTAEDEETPRGGMSEVDRQRLANADWKDKYDEAVRVHGLKERENEAQLAIAKRELTRQGERAAAAEVKLEAASVAAENAAQANAEALQALRAECEAEVQLAGEESEARSAVVTEELKVAAAFNDAEHARELGVASARIAELEASLQAAKTERETVQTAFKEQTARAENLTSELRGMKQRLATTEDRAARYRRALQHGVPAAVAQCSSLRAALVTLAEQQEQLTGSAAMQADEARRALERLSAEQQAADAAGEAKVRALNTELRAVNQGTLTEIEQYQAKVEGLREQLVATDNDKCEARTRAATLERECKQMQEQMWDAKNKAASQAATVANMLNDLEAREAQCEADFAKLRSMNDKLQDREHELMREKITAVDSRRPHSGSGGRSSSREREKGRPAGGRSGLSSRERGQKAKSVGGAMSSRSAPLTTANVAGSGRISRR
jgi:chromosome segregation ATPase